MDIKDIVTSFQTSLKLSTQGITEDTLFSYYKNAQGVVYAAITGSSMSTFIAPAYTSEELMLLLPIQLELNDKYYWVQENGFYDIIPDEYLAEGNNGAELHLQIKNAAKAHYVLQYRHNGLLLAYKHSFDSKYIELTSEGDNDAEAKANMLIKLMHAKALQAV